jgi:Ser/Thr protein kinase RdoA (MazF antagonist)
MMKLSTMKELFDTVDEQGRSPIAAEILTRWMHAAEPPRVWRASANFVFTFKQSGRDGVLRFNHAREREPAELQAEVDFVNHLAGRGVWVSRPQRSLAGHFVESVETPLGLYHAVVFEKLSGRQYDEVAELPPALWPAWGRALAQLHNAAQGYSNSGRPTWQDQFDRLAETLPKDEAAAREALTRARRAAERLPVTAQNFGLIHFDFELDNLIWQDARPGSLDFDDCAGYWYAADIAFALRGIFDDRPDRVDLNHPRLLSFMEGYRSARDLDEAALEPLRLFLVMNRLFQFARIWRACAEGPLAGERPWLTALRHKLLSMTDQDREQFAAYVRAA